MSTCDWCRSTDSVAHYRVRTLYQQKFHTYTVCHFCAHNPNLFADEGTIEVVNLDNNQHLFLHSDHHVHEAPMAVCHICGASSQDRPYLLAQLGNDIHCLCFWCFTATKEPYIVCSVGSFTALLAQQLSQGG